MMLAQQPKVVVGGMKDQFVGVQRLQLRIQVNGGKGIDQLVAVHRANLNEAYLFGIGMKTISFGVNRQPDSGTDHRQEGRKLFISINHW